MAAASNPGLVLFAHGAREPGWADPLRTIRDKVARARPGLAVELAFLEIMKPSLEEAVAQLAAAGRRHVIIAPLFLAAGGHLKHDLPRLVADIRERHAGLEIELMPPIGENPALQDAIASWLVNAIPG